MSIPLVVSKDSRGRLALGSVLKDDQYIVTTTPQGAIVLEPAVILTKQDYELSMRPALRERIAGAIAHHEEDVLDPDSPTAALAD